ncbi:F420-dependent dehydrogenase [Streptomyces viridosporus ATCC 14672]|uniref:F420-dependent dehydrogenase n=1 Tax=Streptomyces viridosporus (strain ATCC 14672 / DSM 40746 / JCM 4963 / KCTC 9882 / NRRL B-12104 / FH 1290) TaxID=566461 RepID=D6AAQ9_STRV1|nr:LLM class flavin-dependent oxidoreductase [Streptomyces viridosporus]EFE72594.1 F420-dependent dehydrogenase [Streptomyces viridosporus ATCC 14672]
MGTPSGPPSLGVLLPTREQAINGAFAGSPLLDFARQAEQLGFDSLWAGDSLIARPRLDPLVVLSAAGAVTSRVTLGTAALTPALRHPLLGAHQVASLDHITGSRLTLGLGSGFPMPETEEEFAAVGASFKGRAGRLDEIVALWRQAWRAKEPGAEPDFAGRYWQAEGLDRLPEPHRPGGPPLWLAGSDTPRVLERVARHYDGWMPFLPSAESYGTAWRRIGELAAAAGRPADAITPALYATITVNEDPAAARAELEHYIAHYYGRTLEQMASVQAYAWGSAEECADALAAYVRSGARHLIIRIGSLTPEPQLKQIADVVLPRVKETSR